MNNLNKSRKRLISIHILGSILFLSFPILFSPDLSIDVLNVPPVQRDILQYFLLLCFFYLTYFYLIPVLYVNKRFVFFGMSIFIVYLIVSLLPETIFQHEPIPFKKPHNPFHFKPHELRHGLNNSPLLHFLHDFGRSFFKFLLILSFAFALSIYQRLKKSEQEKSEAELSYLKAQINPHFLFNSLNGIYSLAIQEGSGQTAIAIEKLSGMMRYVLTEAHLDKVSLEKELNYIFSYIELQRIRFGNTIQLDYEVSGNFSNLSIAPVILITFIENAFKHGINPEENSEIKINIDISEGSLWLFVKNKKVVQNKVMEKLSGLGIENTKVRLQFLYPGKHDLSIKNSNVFYSVYLKIQLND